MSETSGNGDNAHTHSSALDVRTTLDPQRMQLLLRATRSFGASLNLEQVLESVMTETQTVLSAGSWLIWLLDQGDAKLTCWRAQGPDGDAARGYQITLDRGVEGWVIRNGASAYAPDLSNDPRHDSDIAVRNKMLAGSLVACPLNVRSDTGESINTIGVLTVVSSRLDAFTDEDIALVEALAASAAAAIQNARLHAAAQSEIERRRHVESALRESESHYRTLVETSPDSIVLMSLEGKILMCNHRTLVLYDYNHAADLLGKSYLSLISPEARPEAMAIFSKIAQGLPVHRQELTMLRAADMPFAGEISAVLVADGNGSPNRIVTFIRDISDRKQAEAAIRRHNLELQILNDVATHINHSQDLRQMIEGTLDTVLDAMDIDTGWVVLFDPDTGDLAHTETEIRRGLLTKPTVLGPVSDLLHQLIEKASGTRQPVVLRSVELFKLHAGATAPCQVITTPLVAQEQIVGALTIAGLQRRHPRDISFRQVQLLTAIGHQIGAAIENSRLSHEAAEVDLLRQLDNMRADLIANFSHDLRSPLGLIKMGCSTLLRDDIAIDRATQKEFLTDIIAQTDRLNHRIDGILDLGKLEAGQLTLDRTPTDFSTLVRHVFAEIQQQIPSHEFTLELPDEPLIVAADPARIDQVLYNLLDNAVKYSPAGGQIKLCARRKCGKVLFSITDSGIGIPANQCDLIFERFYRVRGEATKHIGGSGLGLTICKGIINAHGGRIRVTSTHGKGSTFTFSLPAVPGRVEV